MPASVRDETIPRSIMFLFLGASAVLLVIQWCAGALNPGTKQAKEPVRKEVSAAQASTPIKAAEPQVKQAESQISTTAQIMTAQTTTTAQTVTSTTKVPEGSPTLVVDLSDRRVYVYQGKQVKVSYPLAIGQEGWETPVGSFQVMEMQRDPKWLHPITKEVVLPGPDNPLGKRWIGFWSDGKTHLGFHGTNQEYLIGQAVSHGCLRMRNQDVIALYDQVSMGTPVIVRK
jgi:lipoprotein-anchoring transpeptidase ErfK/SrfK